MIVTSSAMPLKCKRHSWLSPIVLVGAAVIGTEGLCPRFDPCDNQNLFHYNFGINFSHDGHSYIRAISPFEFTQCYRLLDELTYRLSHPSNIFCMDGAIPAKTSSHIFNNILSRLLQIRDCNCELFSPDQFAAPAACAQAYLNSAISVRLPHHDQWIAAYSCDNKMRSILNFVKHPGSITNAALTASGINFNFRYALRQSHIVLENDILIYHKLIVGSESYARLQLVPFEFYNILFVAFHSKPMGGHFNVYHTLHRLRLHFYWPGIYKFISRMCKACPGCTLSNPTWSESSKLLYSFPIEAPMKVIHIDGYTAGKQQGIKGSKIYLIACCGMCTFPAMEPVSNASVKHLPLLS